MRHRVVSSVCVVFLLTGQIWAVDLTRGLTITGGGNALARLDVERVRDEGAGNSVLTLHVSLSQTRDLKGYGLSLAYDPGKYTFVEAREPDGNLLKTGAGRETLFLASDRRPGVLDIAAARVVGGGVSGEGGLVDLVFRVTETPSASDFQISESVLIGIDGSVDLLSHVEIGNLEALPDRSGLDRNAPNPFNPSTVIAYRLEEAGEVRLAIYNLLGQEVRVLVNERQEAGGFTAPWDGTDEMGRRMASGVYLYRMQAGAFSATRRMVSLK